MVEKFSDQDVVSSTAVAAMLGDWCTSFRRWPQSRLPAVLLLEDECAVESEFGSLDRIKAGKSSTKAQEALAVVYGMHPIIRTAWGMLLGRTGQCYDSKKMYYAIEIHTTAGWALAEPEFVNRFGTGYEFSPYADLASTLIEDDVERNNAGLKDYLIEVAGADNYGLLEFSCKFKKSSDGSEEKEAFAALMRFTADLFKTGRMDEIVTKSCANTVLKEEILSRFLSKKEKQDVKRAEALFSGERKVIEYEKLPALSSVVIAAAIMKIGVNIEQWPHVRLPTEMINLRKVWVEENLKGEAASPEEIAEAISEVTREGEQTCAVIRTLWGMIWLERYSFEFEVGEFSSGYRATVYHDDTWHGEHLASRSEAAFMLMGGRTWHLMERSSAYPVEVEDCMDLGMFSLNCRFDVSSGEEGKAACRQALADFLFIVLSIGLIEGIFEDVVKAKGKADDAVESLAA